MQADNLQILFVEDLPTDMEIAVHELEKGGLACTCRRVETGGGLLTALDEMHPDIVISDYSLPSFDGMSALLMVKEYDPYMPFVILTGSMNEDTAVACIKAGANDYVIKEHLSRLPFAVREAIGNCELLRLTVRQDELLHQNEERYRSIFNGSRAVMLIIDPETAAVMDANDAAVAFYGWPRPELIGKNMSEMNTLEPRMIAMQMRLAMRHEKNHFQFRHKRSDGSTVEVESHASPIYLDGKMMLFSIIHDISDRVAIEKERDALTARLTHYALTSPTITYSFRMHGSEIEWVWTSGNVEKILGYTQRETLEPGWWFNNIASQDREQALRAIPILPGSKRNTQQYRFLKKDRSMLWLRDEMRLVEGESGEYEVVGSFTDISDSKRAEAEIMLKSAALEATAEAIVITDRDGSIEWANEAFETLTGYSRKEALGRNPRELIKSGRQDPQEYSRLWDTIISGQSWIGILVNKRKSGEQYQEKMIITPVRGADGKVEHFIAIKTDVTDQIHSREILQSALNQREVLIREVHHRVKNNMQVISSLLNLSSEGIEDSRSLVVMDALHRRIDAMAFVHEQFYAADDVSSIDFSQYLRQLAGSLIEECPTVPGRPDISYDLEPVNLNLELAIPAGLIVSELLSNSFKFIGEGGQPGSVAISLHRKRRGEVTLEVRDNGPGLPEGFDPGSTATLGLRLVDILSQQLSGTLRLVSDHGTIATLNFKLPPGS